MRIAKNLLQTVMVLGLSVYAGEVRAAESPRCGDGVELTLSAPQASQGSVVVAELRSKTALDDVTGRWSDRDVAFWKESGAIDSPAGPRSNHAPGERATGDRRKALLGVDLEKVAGSYDLAVTATWRDGSHVECSATITVTAGKFATESLKVEKQFVEPNPEQANRAMEEQQKLRALFDRVTPERFWQGAFRMPLKGAIHGTNFGKRRILNGQPRSPHTGADFPVPTGTPVYATQNGRVVLAEELYFSGNTVILDHGLGVYSLYGHLSSTNVALGDAITTGTVLGKVGATGRATGPHLHWGVTVNKARVNPVQLVGAFQTKRPRR